MLKKKIQLGLKRHAECVLRTNALFAIAERSLVIQSLCDIIHIVFLNPLTLQYAHVQFNIPGFAMSNKATFFLLDIKKRVPYIVYPIK